MIAGRHDSVRLSFETAHLTDIIGSARLELAWLTTRFQTLESLIPTQPVVASPLLISVMLMRLHRCMTLFVFVLDQFPIQSATLMSSDLELSSEIFSEAIGEMQTVWRVRRMKS